MIADGPGRPWCRRLNAQPSVPKRQRGLSWYAPRSPLKVAFWLLVRVLTLSNQRFRSLSVALGVLAPPWERMPQQPSRIQLQYGHPVRTETAGCGERRAMRRSLGSRSRNQARLATYGAAEV